MSEHETEVPPAPTEPTPVEDIGKPVAPAKPKNKPGPKPKADPESDVPPEPGMTVVTNPGVPVVVLPGRASAKRVEQSGDITITHY